MESKCKWYAEYEGVCTNGDCPRCADVCIAEGEMGLCRYDGNEAANEEPMNPGQEIWTRDSGGEVSGYVFLAVVGDFIICTPYINDYDTVHEMMLYHEYKTESNYDTDLCVFFRCNCYTSLEEAEAALEVE